MIYQLYPTKKDYCEPFSKYYIPICLECLPQEYLLQLKIEYSSMIYLYKNNIDEDNWIGFTSHKQFIKNKSNFILDESNYLDTLEKLNNYDILCWHYLQFNISISQQAEKYHKNINNNITFLFNEIYKESIPQNFYGDNCGCFANYWIMTKQNFYEFMDWSYPKVQKIVELSNKISDLKLGKHYCNSNFIIERLFLLWYMKFNKIVYPLFKQTKSI
jgi:hypothetical protein